jgi:hypothetical protein
MVALASLFENGRERAEHFPISLTSIFGVIARSSLVKPGNDTGKVNPIEKCSYAIALKDQSQGLAPSP